MEVITLGTLVAACIVIGLAVGSWLDRFAGISPWGVVFGLCWGIAAACVQGYKLVMKANEKFERENERENGRNSERGNKREKPELVPTDHADSSPDP